MKNYTTHFFIWFLCFAASTFGPLAATGWSKTGKGSSDACKAEISKAKAIIDEDFRLFQMKKGFDTKGLCKQITQLANYVGFRRSIRFAMESVLEDGDHPESPLALMIYEAFEALNLPVTVPPPSRVVLRAEQQLYDFLNRSSTEVKVLGLKDRPEGGEDPQKFWIFQWKIPDFSDHGFWTVVDREGFTRPYTYGFN